MAKVRLFLSKLIVESVGEKESKNLLDDFRLYKQDGILPSTFGRDAPYDFTHNRQYLELKHIHIKREGKEFSLKLLQFSRKSGYVLVYCPGFYDSNAYLLITVIRHWNYKEPLDIEDTDKDEKIMEKLEFIAEKFREKF